MKPGEEMINRGEVMYLKLTEALQKISEQEEKINAIKESL